MTVIVSVVNAFSQSVQTQEVDVVSMNELEKEVQNIDIIPSMLLPSSVRSTLLLDTPHGLSS